MEVLQDNLVNRRIMKDRKIGVVIPYIAVIRSRICHFIKKYDIKHTRLNVDECRMRMSTKPIITDTPDQICVVT